MTIKYFTSVLFGFTISRPQFDSCYFVVGIDQREILKPRFQDVGKVMLGSLLRLGFCHSCC